MQVQQLTSSNLTDTNETSEIVSITSSTLTNFNPSAGLSLPAYSMTVLSWSTSTGAPVISGVRASGITQTAATISWTTDEPASSLVNYGLTSAPAFSSTPNSTLVTNHSVTLTGLTPGTIYDYVAVSANSAGNSAASPSFTFATASSGSNNSATFLGTDATTQGTWTGNYGADGHIIANDVSAPPNDAAVALTGQSAWTWNSSTSAAAALQVSLNSRPHRLYLLRH